MTATAQPGVSGLSHRANTSSTRVKFGACALVRSKKTSSSQAAADADLASADRAVAFAQVDLFRALGGGWTES